MRPLLDELSIWEAGKEMSCSLSCLRLALNGLTRPSGILFLCLEMPDFFFLSYFASRTYRRHRVSVSFPLGSSAPLCWA